LELLEEDAAWAQWISQLDFGGDPKICNLRVFARWQHSDREDILVTLVLQLHAKSRRRKFVHCRAAWVTYFH